MPRTRWRVVWGLSDTIDTLAPQIALTSDDLPTLGRPTNVTKPDSDGSDPRAGRHRRSVIDPCVAGVAELLGHVHALITGLDELRTLVGEHLGYSDYLEITQERVEHVRRRDR